MKNPLSYYLMLAQRWAWMVILGTVICGTASFGISKITPPVYEASTTLIISLGASTSAAENFTVSVQAVPTYAQLLVSPAVLMPVVDQHPGLTLQQLKAMITVKPQSNTQLIELDIDNNDPQLAVDLVNEIAQSFAQFANGQLPGTVQVLPAQKPTEPIRPKTLTNTGIGALVGLGLALTLIVIFEWRDDHLTSAEEAQEWLGMEILTIFPWLPRQARARKTEQVSPLAEGYRILSASLDIAQQVKPFKMVMVTSPLTGEGKSSIAANLATFLAMAGNPVLLVDADLRRPSLHRYFEIEEQPELGMTFQQEWAGTDEHSDAYLTYLTDVPNLHVLPAKGLPANFTDMLLSKRANQILERFQKAPFHYVIFDTSPLLPAADTQILAAYIQTVILVIDPFKTPRKLLLRVKQLLNKTHIRALGVVINKSHWPEHGEIRQHLQDRRPQRAIRSAPALPAATRPPETPPLNGLADLDTVALPRFQARQEKEDK